MASLSSFAVLEWIRKIRGEEQVDFLRELMQMFAQSLIDAEITQKVGANPYERTEERRTQRNGYRKREWDTRLGTLDLKIPKLRQGSFFPSILGPGGLCQWGQHPEGGRCGSSTWAGRDQQK